MNTEQRYIIEGLSVGTQANNAIADAIAAKATKMLEEALQDNFETILQAKLSAAVQETINLHADRSKQFAQKFLVTGKTQLAQNLIDTQHNHRLGKLSNNLSLGEIEDFDTDLSQEVAKLADEAGTIAIEFNPESAIGF
jgi:hypothetical protein